jgi:thioredoxin-like negative regulator of GroEL
MVAINIAQKRKKLLPEFINRKPTLIFFWADNKRCKTMSSFVEKIKEDFNGSVKVLSFNVMKDYRIAENYLILSVPVLVLFDKEGNLVLKISDPRELSRLESKLKEII